MRVLLVLLLLPLSGCLDAGGLSGLLDPREGGPVSTTWSLDSQGQARQAVPEDGVVPIAWSWGEWFRGDPAPRWDGPGFDEAIVITAAQVTIAYETMVPLTHTQTRPSFTIWFGAGDSVIEHAFADGPDIWLPGDIQTITFDVDDLPAGGLVVERGDRAFVEVGTYYPDGSGTDNVWIHVGQDASRMDLTYHPVRLPDVDGITVLDDQVDLAGGRCVAPLNPDDMALATYTFDVPEQAKGLDIVAARVAGVGGQDMDFGIMDAAGQTVAHAAGSGSTEAVHLRAPNLEAAERGAWTLTVYNCQPQAATHDVTVQLLL